MKHFERRWFKASLIILFCLVPVTRASAAHAPSAVSVTDRDNELIRSLPLKTKIGQLLMVGFMGTKIESSLGSLIERVQPGAVLVFKRNIESARQISTLNQQAQRRSIQTSHLPLLISVDQEGGDVIRIVTAPPLPSALALGKTHDLSLIERAGRATGLLLKTLGFNMNLAPVLDLADPTQHRFIGSRSFGAEAEAVSKDGRSFAAGLAASGILATAKHFPGHGSVTEDSHLQTPLVNKNLFDLRSRDFLPFSEFQRSTDKPRAIMIAHVVFSALDPTGMPATFSKPILTDLLRGQLGFNGLIVTDDIEMGGAQFIPDIRERAIRAIEAGADIIMVGWNAQVQASIAEGLMRAVQTKRISEARLHQSLVRIFAAKRAYAETMGSPSKSPLATASDNVLRKAVQNPEFASVGQSVLNSHFQRPKSAREQKFIANAANGPLFIFTSSATFWSGLNRVATAAKRSVKRYPLTTDLSVRMIRAFGANPAAHGIVYASGFQATKLINTIPRDIAARLALVTVEPTGFFRNIDDFAAVSDVYYRHPDLGRQVGLRYLGNELIAETTLRSPSSDRPIGKKSFTH